MPGVLCDAKIIFRKDEFLVKEGMAEDTTLETLNIPRESVIPTLAGAVVSEEVIMRDGDVIKLIPVISDG